MSHPARSRHDINESGKMNGIMPEVLTFSIAIVRIYASIIHIHNIYTSVIHKVSLMTIALFEEKNGSLTLCMLGIFHAFVVVC